MEDLSLSVAGGEYHAFLIRLWRSTTDSQWRASLEDAATGEIFVFSELESMYLFLHSRTIEQRGVTHYLEPV